MPFDYTVKTNKSFDEAALAVVQETLGDKDLEIEPFKIVEICNAKSAYAVLKADIKIGLCLPCKVNVYVKDGSIPLLH